MMEGFSAAPLTSHGERTVQPNGSMTLPAAAQRAMGMVGGGKVLIFSQPGRVIMTPPPPSEQLLALASELAAERAAELGAAAEDAEPESTEAQ